MPEEIRHPDGRIEHPGVRWEESDASFGGIVAILIGSAVFLLVLHVAVYAFFTGYRDHLAGVNRSAFPLAPGPSIALPGEPHLEQIDRLTGSKESNVHVRMAAKLHTLNSYGPAETQGFVHVPIDRAMRLIVEKKLLKARPDIPAADQRRSTGLVDAGESNAGRLLKGGAK